MINSFNDLKINSNIISALEKQKIISPTKIQAFVIPEAMLNKDIIGESHTGSGKTLAYLIPVFEKIDTSKRENQVLILAPTHELVMQIDAQARLLAENSGIPVTTAAIIGEANIENQIKKLRDIKPHIIVGTKGRVWDLIQKKKIKSHTIKTIIIDEADNMLDSDNLDQVNSIIKTTMKDRQLMAFSATISPAALKTAKELMKQPCFFKVSEENILNPNIAHMYFLCEKREKFELLRKLISATGLEKSIVFVNNNDEIQLITEKLNYHKKNAGGIYGALPKEERKKTINSFRQGNITILVSSDLSSRGLDFPDVDYILNLDFPLDSKEYLHRAGRTARGNSSGTCISIITERELAAIRVYEREFNITFERGKLFEGKIYKV